MATILIVDDQAIDRQRLAVLLGHYGHRVLEAPGGGKALEIARAEKPDVVLADILMPDMDGCQFVARLRAEMGVASPRVVFRAAAYLETEARALARACGCIHFATKSTDTDALLAVINAALSRPLPVPEEPRPAPDSLAVSLRSLVVRLHQRVAELENLNAQGDRRMAEYVAQLGIARSALEQEVTKRIWAEKELTESNLRLHDQAVRDTLTGLHNRRYLEESLDREVSRAKRGGLPVGVMMIDIDRFKHCNDTFGHAAGDAVLRAVGQYVLSLTRSEDLLCRYGGEEFVLVMAQASQHAVLERAEALRRGVQGLEIEHDGRRIGPVTLSIGIAMLLDHGENGNEMLQAADAAMYQAKKAGRNRVVMANRLSPSK